MHDPHRVNKFHNFAVYIHTFIQLQFVYIPCYLVRLLNSMVIFFCKLITRVFVPCETQTQKILGNDEFRRAPINHH